MPLLGHGRCPARVRRSGCVRTVPRCVGSGWLIRRRVRAARTRDVLASSWRRPAARQGWSGRAVRVPPGRAARRLRWGCCAACTDPHPPTPAGSRRRRPGPPALDPVVARCSSARREWSHRRRHCAAWTPRVPAMTTGSISAYGPNSSLTPPPPDVCISSPVWSPLRPCRVTDGRLYALFNCSRLVWRGPASRPEPAPIDHVRRGVLNTGA
jgi:hypothetical protein